MDEATRKALRHLNLDFYQRRAADFDRHRRRPWRGWRRLVRLLARSGDPLSVLDVGCGNGRFGSFLFERLARPILYLGIDASPALLQMARERLPSDARLREHDLLASSLPDELSGFGLIALFGFLHHVPGREARRALLAHLLRRLGTGGLLAATFWQWREHPRLRRRIVPWSEFPFDGPRLEPEDGDHLLRWGDQPGELRYCHHFADSEIEELLASLGVERVADFRAEGELNRYLILPPAGAPGGHPDPS